MCRAWGWLRYSAATFRFKRSIAAPAHTNHMFRARKNPGFRHICKIGAAHNVRHQSNQDFIIRLGFRFRPEDVAEQRHVCEPRKPRRLIAFFHVRKTTQQANLSITHTNDGFIHPLRNDGFVNAADVHASVFIRQLYFDVHADIVRSIHMNRIQLDLYADIHLLELGRRIRDRPRRSDSRIQ
jgi:hypothetical protein